MDLRTKIINEYQMTVLHAPINSELKRALKYNERVPMFINKLQREISDAPVKLTDDQIAYAVKSMTELFLKLIEKTADEKHISEIEKHRRIAENEAAIEKEKVGSAIALGKEVEFDGDVFKVRDDGEA